MIEAGQGVPRNTRKAIYWFKKSEKQGDPKAQSIISILYKDGYDIYNNGKQAFYWQEKHAKLGNAIAQYNVGNMFKEGFITKKNYPKSFYWFKNRLNKVINCLNLK